MSWRLERWQAALVLHELKLRMNQLPATAREQVNDCLQQMAEEKALQTEILVEEVEVVKWAANF
jgi:hypothetical protein